MTTITRWAAGFAAVLIGTLGALKAAPAPFIWIGLIWLVFAIVAVRQAKSTPLRMLAQTIAATAFTLTAVEGYLSIIDRPLPLVTRDYKPGPYVNDTVLGWRLVPDQVTRAVARLGDTVLYDVSYTTDSLGHRIGYPDSSSKSSPCAVFVVCSFSFGEGLPDQATLPYRVGARTHGRVQTVNLGVPGYGVEHLLASLEQDFVRLPCNPTHVVYQALAHHVVRAAHIVPYSKRGPGYTSQPDGGVTYAGTERIPPVRVSGLWFEVDYQLMKSRVYRVLTEPATPNGSLEDLRLYLGIVRRARELFLERYPRAEFHVLAWDLHGAYAGSYAALRDSLARIEPRLHEVSGILPNYAAEPRQYQIGVRDPHPNAVAYDRLAGFVVDSIIKDTHH